MACCNSRQRLYALSGEKLARLNKIGKMSILSADATLTSLCDSILETVCIIGSILTDTFTIPSTRRSGKEVTLNDNMPLILLPHLTWELVE